MDKYVLCLFKKMSRLVTLTCHDNCHLKKKVPHYLCLHHSTSLLTDVSDKSINVYHPLCIYLVHHGVQDNERAGAAHASTGEKGETFTVKIQLQKNSTTESKETII